MSIPTDPVLSGPPLPLAPYLFRALQDFKPIIHPAPFPKDSGYLNTFWWTAFSKCPQLKQTPHFLFPSSHRSCLKESSNRDRSGDGLTYEHVPRNPSYTPHYSLLQLKTDESVTLTLWDGMSITIVCWSTATLSALFGGLDKGMEWDEGKHGVRKPGRI